VRCEKIAASHKKLDWLRRLDFSTETPPCGPLRKGEIAVEKIATGKVIKGVQAVRLIFSQVPVYLIFYPVLYLPFVARRIDKDLGGCNGDSCEIALT
jgi:hypothetical protein